MIPSIPSHPVEMPVKAVAYRKPLPIADAESLIDVELPESLATGRDLLVEVRAVAVNPVDTKVRQRAAPGKPLGAAAGIVPARLPEGGARSRGRRCSGALRPDGRRLRIRRRRR